MNKEEIWKKSRLNYIVKLWLEESINEYTLNKIEYKKLKYFKSIDESIYSGYIIVKERYSNITMKVKLINIYKWNKWRNTKLLQSRYTYLEKHTHILGFNLNNYRNRYGFHNTLKIRKDIAKLALGVK